MAIPSPKRLLCWLLNALIPALAVVPVGAMESLLTPRPRSVQAVGERWLSQKHARREQANPAEVQGRFDAAKLAAARGDATEALRFAAAGVGLGEGKSPVTEMVETAAYAL